MSDQKFPPRVVGKCSAASYNNRFEFTVKSGSSRPDLTGMEYLSLAEHESIVRALTEAASNLLEAVDENNSLGGESFEETEPLRELLAKIREGR